MEEIRKSLEETHSSSTPNQPAESHSSPSVRIPKIGIGNPEYRDECMASTAPDIPSTPCNNLHCYEDNNPHLLVSSSWPPPSLHLPLQALTLNYEEDQVHNGVAECVRPLSRGGADEEVNRVNPPRPSDEFDWADYRSFLFGVWQNYSLEKPSFDDESSSMPFMSASSGEIPFALNLLTPKEVNQEREEGLSQSPFDDISSYFEEYDAQKERRNSPQTNDAHSPPDGPRPSANMMKETSNAQGELRARLALRLRSKPLEMGAETLPPTHGERAQRPPNSYPATQCHDGLYPRHSNEFHAHRSRPLTPNSTNPPPAAHFATASAHLSGPPPPRGTQSYAFDASTGSSDTWKCRCSEVATRAPYDANWDPGRAAPDSQGNRPQRMEDSPPSLDLARLLKDRPLPPPSFNRGMPQCPNAMTYPVFQHKAQPPLHGLYPSPPCDFGCSPHRPHRPHHHPVGRRASCSYPCDAPQHGGPEYYPRAGSPESPEAYLPRQEDPAWLASVQEQFASLQRQNMKLNFYLKKEELRRKEAEMAVQSGKRYIQSLQESLQDMSTSTLVIDPTTYKQVADKYIASKKKPVRRTHTCNPTVGFYSDLVCDSSKHKNIIQNENRNSSCPSSPRSSELNRKTFSTPSSPHTREAQLQVETSLHSPRLEVSPTQSQTVKSTPFHTWKGQGKERNISNQERNISNQEYRELIQNLDSLQVSASPS